MEADGWYPPASTPVSLRTTLPAVPPELGVVERVGDAVETETVSEPHGDATPLLAVSPLYVAVQLQVPTRSAAVVLLEE